MHPPPPSHTHSVRHGRRVDPGLRVMGHDPWLSLLGLEATVSADSRSVKLGIVVGEGWVLVCRARGSITDVSPERKRRRLYWSPPSPHPSPPPGDGDVMGQGLTMIRRTNRDHTQFSSTKQGMPWRKRVMIVRLSMAKGDRCCLSLVSLIRLSLVSYLGEDWRGFVPLVLGGFVERALLLKYTVPDESVAMGIAGCCLSRCCLGVLTVPPLDVRTVSMDDLSVLVFFACACPPRVARRPSTDAVQRGRGGGDPRREADRGYGVPPVDRRRAGSDALARCAVTPARAASRARLRSSRCSLV